MRGAIPGAATAPEHPAASPSKTTAKAATLTLTKATLGTRTGHHHPSPPGWADAAKVSTTGNRTYAVKRTVITRAVAHRDRRLTSRDAHAARSAFGSPGCRLCWKMRILVSANRPGQCWSPRLARRRSAIGNLLAAGFQPGGSGEPPFPAPAALAAGQCGRAGPLSGPEGTDAGPKQQRVTYPARSLSSAQPAKARSCGISGA